jgi:hypothetical protein
MKFHITFVSDSDGSLPKETLEKQGIHFLHGFDAIPFHLMAEGGKYHYVLLYEPGAAFRHLPYVRAYAPYSKVIYWITNPQPTVRPANPAFPDDNTELRRFELLNAACADLVLVADDKEKNNLFAVQPETKVAILPNLTAHSSDNRSRKYWAGIFAATGKPFFDQCLEDNEATSLTFLGDMQRPPPTSASLACSSMPISSDQRLKHRNLQ